jgi:hypothetical protein
MPALSSLRRALKEIAMNPVDVSKLRMVPISSADDASINWTAAFACYGG